MNMLCMKLVLYNILKGNAEKTSLGICDSERNEELNFYNVLERTR